MILQATIRETNETARREAGRSSKLESVVDYLV